MALTFAGHGTFVDENLVIQTVESMVTQGNLTVDKMFQALPGPDGNYYSRYGISFPALLTPFYLAGYALDAWFPQTYAFFGNPHFFMMLWGNLLLTGLTGWLFYRLCLRLGGTIRVSVFLTLALVFASPFWPYSQTLFRLTAATANLLAVFYVVLVCLEKRSIGLLVFLAALVAFGLNLREDLVLGFMAIGLFVLAQGKGTARWAVAVSLIVGALVGLVVWGWHNWIRFGTVFVESYEDLSFDFPMIVSLPQLVYGLRRGLIVYAPLALLLPLSFCAARRKNYLSIWWLCVGILGMYFVLYAKSDMWYGGRCWGPRHMYFLLPFCLLPGIWWIERHSKKWVKILLGLAFLAGVVVNGPGVYAHQGKYQNFLDRPSLYPLLIQPVVHPEYITFDELDLWWIRMIKMNPVSLWPLAFVAMLALTSWSVYGLWKSLRFEAGDAPALETDRPRT